MAKYRSKISAQRALNQAVMEYVRQAACVSFVSFLVYIDDDYFMQWFHKIIAEKCQKLAEGEIKKLMLFIPPQFGKSEIVSRKFPAWAMGRNPSLKIVECSYSASLSASFSRQVQRIMESDRYANIFPRLGANKKRKKTNDYFDNPVGEGFYKAVGVGGSLTGTPADIAIIDDPIKDAAEAYSLTYRDKVWEWYNSVLTTRLHNNSRQLFIMTRWHEDDLAGRILKAEPNEWEVISLPAICETENDGGLSSRHIGESLWESKHSLEKLLTQQARSPRTFAALYQQHPTANGGNIVQREWFKRCRLADFERMRTDEPIVFFIDTAYTDNTANDPTGIIATCKIGQDLYVTNAKKVYMKFPDLLRFVPLFAKSNGYTQRSSIRIEPKANGLSVIDQLKEQTGLNVVRTPSPTDSKETRLNVASSSVEAGRVVLVDGVWNEEFIDEVCGFPTKPHDEYVDVMCYAIGYHLTSPFKEINRARIANVAY